MQEVPVYFDDARRVAALRSYDILDSAAEVAYDAIVVLAAALCDVPVALLSFLDEDRMWVKARHGPFDVTLTRAASFCGHTIGRTDDFFIVEDARADARFQANPIVVGPPYVRSYAGFPVVSSDGYALGAVCTIDFDARVPTDRERAALRLAARCIESFLEERRLRQVLERARGEQRRLAHDNRDLASEIERRAAVERRLSFAARHDPLTKLANRGYFVERLSARIATGPTLRASAPFAVMFVDIDRFKEVNDTYGHLLGDALLIAIARRLSHFVRGDDVVARLGGDEFTVLVDTVDDCDSLARFADRLASAIAVPFRIDGVEVSVSASVGIVVASDAYVRSADVLRDADAAMFAAKAAGRNRCEFFRADREHIARS